jgi:cytoskeletal protein RodZ
VPVARYGPPDDPHYPDDEPTAYINYGEHGAPRGLLPGEPLPWYRKPVALVAYGALGAVLIALIVFGLVKLLTGGSSPESPTTLTPITRTTTSATAPATTTTTTEPTTTEPTTTEPTTTTTTTEPTTTTTTATTTTTTEPSVSTSISTSTRISTVTQTVTVSPPP